MAASGYRVRSRPSSTRRAHEDVDTIIAIVPSRWRLPLRVLEETGMRVGELHALEWGDVDEAGWRSRR
jgi:integrase